MIYRILAPAYDKNTSYSRLEFSSGSLQKRSKFDFFLGASRLQRVKVSARISAPAYLLKINKSFSEFGPAFLMK